MTSRIRNSRIGMYECDISPDGTIKKGHYIRGDYIGVFNWDDLVNKIIPDVIDNDRIPRDKYPVLIASWQLRGSRPSRSVPFAISVIGMNYPRRKKIEDTQQWEAVLYISGEVQRVEGHRLVGQNRK